MLVFVFYNFFIIVVFIRIYVIINVILLRGVIGLKNLMFVVFNVYKLFENIIILVIIS